MITVATKLPNDYKLMLKGIDLTAKLIPASNATKGNTYYCPFCGAKIHKKTSQNGVDFFARNNGEIHTNEVCKQIDKNKKDLYTTYVPDFTEDNLWNHIFIEPKEDSSNHKPTGTDGPDNPSGDLFPTSGDDSIDSSDDEDESEDEPDPEEDKDDYSLGNETIIKQHPVVSISPLIEQLFDRRGPNYVINTGKNIRISDVLLAAPSFGKVFENPDIINNCRKIIELQPDYSVGGDKILCHIFDKEGNKIYFVLCFADIKQHKKASKKMFTKGSWDNGAPRDIRKFSSIFVAGLWKKDPKGFFDKKTQTIRPLFICDVINASTQICTHNRYKEKSNN